MNGDPSTGTQGSIPPAASIEHPQREIANFIADARLTPDAADLHQLGKSVQSNGVVYCDDGGTLNQLVITVNPPVTALIKGMVFIVKSPISNTGPTTLKVNSLAPVAIVRATDQHALELGDISANAMLAYGYDGAQFQMVWTQRQPGAPIYLTVPRTYYVNNATGLDTYDGQAATVGSGHGPYKTIQKACDQIGLYNMNKFSITINVADGNYGQFVVPQQNGAGNIYINGNPTTPASVAVSGTTATTIDCRTGGNCFFDGFKVTNTATATPGDWMSGIMAYGAGTWCYMENMEFGVCTGPHIAVSGNGMVANTSPHSKWKITGSAADFIRCFSSQVGVNAVAGPDITIPSAIAYSGSFLNLAYGANSIFIYGALTGAANVTGLRYSAAQNSTISTAGGGADYYPGTIAGVLSTGGQYS